MSALGKRKAFTLAEMLVGIAIMLVVIIAALTVYSRSNQITVDQQQYTEIQNGVRSAMFLLMRDIRMTGVGFPTQFNMYAIQGVDNETQGSATVKPDRLKIIGNMENPLGVAISQYAGNSTTLTLADYSFEQYPYLDTFYTNKFVLILPNPASACRAGEMRIIASVSHPSGGTGETLTFSPGMAPGLVPPENLLGTCSDSSTYVGGSVMFADLKEYWLDLTGNYPGLTAGLKGYIGGGVGGVFYMTANGTHYPIAQNVENFQVEYNGDFNDDGLMENFQPWNATWTLDNISRVRQVRIYLLGRTPNRLASHRGAAPAGIFIYRRPTLSNSVGDTTDDMHRRFLLESSSNIRNLSLNLYNTGQR